jgi:hypothetical protein
MKDREGGAVAVEISLWSYDGKTVTNFKRNVKQQ